jgi:hypothetical protein
MDTEAEKSLCVGYHRAGRIQRGDIKEELLMKDLQQLVSEMLTNIKKHQPVN